MSSRADRARIETTIELDPAVEQRHQEERAYRFNVFQVPVLRMVGFALLLALVLVHNRVRHTGSSSDTFTFASILAGYSALSWVVLRLFYRRSGFDLGLFFLNLDLVLLVLAVYYSGAENSMLFFLPLIRVADQTNTSFRRVRSFAHLATLLYALFVLYLAEVEGRNLSLATEILKTLTLYCSGLYISLTAKAAERLRDRTRAAIEVARKLILDLKAQSSELEQARIRAEEASRHKSEFLTNVSHEIRTPMSGIIGMTELALGTHLEPLQRDYVETVRDSARSLLRIIDDVLDFSKIESGRIELEEIDFGLRETVAEASRSLAVLARGKGIDFSWRVDPDVPDRLRADPGRLRQVLLNLLSNAMKFTDRGSVGLSVGREADEDGLAVLRFSVADTGIGIPAAQQDSIFGAFVQADGSMTRRHGGTGLGLTISQRLVAIMGGKIELISEPGAGSTFSFKARFALAAPSPPAEEPLRPPSPPPRDRALRILVTEDNAVNQRLAQRLLEARGHTVSLAVNGREAVLALEHEHFDLVLMDVQMPVMDGLQATAAIRARETAEQRSRTPILALTAHALSQEKERCLAAGMDDYVTKPIDPDRLLAAIGGLTSLPPAATQTGERVEPRAQRTLDAAEALARVGGDRNLLRLSPRFFARKAPTSSARPGPRWSVAISKASATPPTPCAGASAFSRRAKRSRRHSGWNRWAARAAERRSRGPWRRSRTR